MGQCKGDRALDWTRFGTRRLGRGPHRASQGGVDEAPRLRQTLFGLADSLVGLAAWLIDHNDVEGQPAAAVVAGLQPASSETGELTRDEILDNIMLYWMPNTGVPASRLYRVITDGQPPGAAHGIDIDDQGDGAVNEQRLYELIRQPKPIVDRQFKIEFFDSGERLLRLRSADRWERQSVQ